MMTWCKVDQSYKYGGYSNIYVDQSNILCGTELQVTSMWVRAKYNLCGSKPHQILKE